VESISREDPFNMETLRDYMLDSFTKRRRYSPNS